MPAARARARHDQGARQRRTPVGAINTHESVEEDKVINATVESFIFALTGAPQKIDDFVSLISPIGLVSRTGVAAISRGAEPFDGNFSIAPPQQRACRLLVLERMPAPGRADESEGA